MRRIVIIPMLNPDEKFTALLKNLIAAGLRDLLVVNDGSAVEYDPYFRAAEALGATVLTHPVNRGKGQALKTAFAYITELGEPAVGVCADGDGQHVPEDIIACLDAAQANPGALVMGCRQFEDKQIPLRSRFGNKLTCFVFRMFCGVKVSDTQTGLRALDDATMRKFLDTRGERYEYEMNMLIDSREKEVPIIEVPIRTIYIEENKSSHFHPLRDSFRIYAVFSKFILSSLLSFGVDILLFWIFSRLLGLTALSNWWVVLIATAAARIFSSLVNYTLNQKRVFRGESGARSLLRYYILCAVQMLCSAALVSGLSELLPSWNNLIIKLIVDTLLFILSFQIQREWVFAKKKEK